MEDLISGVFVDCIVLLTLEYAFPHPLKKEKHPLFPAISQLYEKNADSWHILHIPHFVCHAFLLSTRSDNAIKLSMGIE